MTSARVRFQKTVCARALRGNSESEPDDIRSCMIELSHDFDQDLVFRPAHFVSARAGETSSAPATVAASVRPVSWIHSETLAIRGP